MGTLGNNMDNGTLPFFLFFYFVPMTLLEALCDDDDIIINLHFFSLLHNWSKRVTWPNIPKLKLGNTQECSPNACVLKNTEAFIWLKKNMLKYLSGNVICFSKLTVFLKLHSLKTVYFSEQINIRACFCTKWRLFLIYSTCIYYNHVFFTS